MVKTVVHPSQSDLWQSYVKAQVSLFPQAQLILILGETIPMPAVCVVLLTYNCLLVCNKSTHAGSFIGHTELGHTPCGVDIRTHGHAKETNLSQAAV